MAWRDPCAGGGRIIAGKGPYVHVKLTRYHTLARCPLCGRWLRIKVFGKAGTGWLGVPAHNRPGREL